MDKSLSIFLDFLRWLSAFAVLLGHVRAFVFPPFPELQSPGVLLKCFYWVTGFGHQAVIIFFVLSGFLVGGGVVNKLREGRFSWPDYLIHRFARLYPVLIVALLLGWGLDYLGLVHFDHLGLYTVKDATGVIGVIDYNAAGRINLRTFLVNFFMLQGIWGTPFGTNGPLWSLSMEFWYYLMFPPLAMLLVHRSVKSLLNWNGLVLVLLAVLLPLEFHRYFGIWLFGVAAAALPIPVRRPGLAAAVLFLALTDARVGFGSQYVRDLFLGLACAILIAAVKHSRSFPVCGAKVHERLAGFSYSLYLFHFPMVVFLLSAFAECGLWHSDMGTASRFRLFIGLLGLCLACCYAFSRFTEARTPALRRLLIRLLGSSRAPQATVS